MINVYTAFIPILIIAFVYLVKQRQMKGMKDVFELMYKSLIYLYLYQFVLYYLSMEEIVDTGWSVLTFMYYVVVFTVVALIGKTIYWIRDRKSGIA